MEVDRISGLLDGKHTAPTHTTRQKIFAVISSFLQSLLCCVLFSLARKIMQFFTDCQELWLISAYIQTPLCKVSLSTALLRANPNSNFSVTLRSRNVSRWNVLFYCHPLLSHKILSGALVTVTRALGFYRNASCSFSITESQTGVYSTSCSFSYQSSIVSPLLALLNQNRMHLSQIWIKQ